MKEYTANAILYISVASVFITWAVTGHLEDVQELKQQQEIILDAFNKGYIQCVENNEINASFAKVVWKKECNKSERRN